MNPSITHQRLFSTDGSEYSNGPHKIISFPLKPLFENLKSVSFSMNRFFRILGSCNNGTFQDSLKPTKASEFNLERDYTIFGSCNGLLCLFDRYDGCVRLWNPSIRLKSKKSPTLDYCEYNKCWIACRGFGYDHVNDKYKVLIGLCRYIQGSGYRKYGAKIYTFGEDSLKTIPNFPFPDIAWDGKFVSGTLNWIMLKRGVSSNQNVIISFNLEKETCKEVLLPEHDAINVRYPTLCVSTNRLYVCFN